MSDTPCSIRKLIHSDPLRRPTIPPLSVLARKLEFLHLGIPTSTIFCFNEELPDEYDPANPPEGIAPNSTRAFLLENFFRTRTKCQCTVKEFNPLFGSSKQCQQTLVGFQDMLKHQREVHEKTSTYVCVVEDCMALFDKIGNARRHAENQHTVEGIVMKEAIKARRKAAMQRLISAAEKRAEMRKIRRKSAEQKRRAMRASHERDRRKNAAKTVRKVKHAVSTEMETVKNSVTLRIRIKPPVLHVASVIKKGVKGKIKLEITPTNFTQEDIGEFHRKNIRRNRLRGKCNSTGQEEWVAVTGLLDLHYGSGRVAYRFL